MSLEKLLQERDELRDEIEKKRKQNEDVLLYIKGFISKIPEYVDMCNRNDISVYKWHEFDGNKYWITCNKHTFAINLYDRNALCDIGQCYVRYENGNISHCLVGNPPTLQTITEKNGSLTYFAQWFNRNIKIITKFIDADMEECVRKQIDDAKKMLGK